MASGVAGGRVRNQVRRLLSPAGRQRVGDLLCHPLLGSFLAAVLRNRLRSGPFWIQTSAATISARTKAQIFWGFYESAEIRMVNRHLQRDLDLLEVGSSLGVVSLHAIGRLSEDARIVCVEANPELLPALRCNIESNHPGRNVVILDRVIDYANAPRFTRLQLFDASKS